MKNWTKDSGKRMVIGKSITIECTNKTKKRNQMNGLYKQNRAVKMFSELKKWREKVLLRKMMRNENQPLKMNSY